MKNPIFDELIQLKLISKLNLVTLSNRTRDKKIKVIKDLKTKIIFFDKTYVVGQITKIDEAKVHIIPMGLDTSEGILVANVDTLRLEDGKIAVLNSSVKFFYQDGKITENNDDWLDEYDDFKYDQDISSFDDSYKYKGQEKTNHPDISSSTL